MKHLKYLSYVIRHKFFVLLAGRKVGSSLWRLLIHDLSKFSPSEWGPYVNYFYGEPTDGHTHFGNGSCQQCDDRRDAFDAAWLHHQHHNPHHWQYWLLREDDGDTKTIPMPESYAREMVADWMGAGRAITGKWEAAAWYKKNYDKIELSGSTRDFVNKLLDVQPPTREERIAALEAEIAKGLAADKEGK